MTDLYQALEEALLQAVIHIIMDLHQIKAAQAQMLITQVLQPTVTGPAKHQALRMV